MNIKNLLLQGSIGGLLAGIAFIVAETLSSGSIQENNFLYPFRLIAAFLLQRDPSDVTFPTVLAVALVFNLLYAMVLGVIGAYLLALFFPNSVSDIIIILYGMAFGFLVWVFNYYILARMMTLPWFVIGVNPFVQFLWYTFVFGMVLGLYFRVMLGSRDSRLSYDE